MLYSGMYRSSSVLEFRRSALITASGLIPAPGSFAASAFPVPPERHRSPPIKHPLALGAAASRSWVPQENGVITENSIRVTFTHVLT